MPLVIPTFDDVLADGVLIGVCNDDTWELWTYEGNDYHVNYKTCEVVPVEN